MVDIGLNDVLDVGAKARSSSGCVWEENLSSRFDDWGDLAGDMLTCYIA